MPEVNSIPQQAPESTAQIESADLVIGVLVDLDAESILSLCQGLQSLPGAPRIVVLQSSPAGSPVESKPQPADGNGSTSPSLSLVPWSALGPDPATAAQRSISAACQSLFEVSDKLQARGCCMVASKMESASSQWVSQIAEPLLEADVDLVIPYYPLRKLQGLLNSSIIYPLTRALYGKRIHNPLGPDVGVSRKLAQKIVTANRNTKPGQNPTHPLASLSPISSCENLPVCQVRVGARSYPPTDWTNMSSLLSQVLAPIFLIMEKNAACWQKTRGSVAVPTRGESPSLPAEAEALDMTRMVETFQLGVRDLQEIWRLVLPPATLFELRQLSRLTPDQVSMPDELWARILYDFALAHRLRTINRDHLLRSLTPLYLAWVFSYARELESISAASVDERIERLCMAFETAKPYLVSRWRWPDRFNP